MGHPIEDEAPQATGDRNPGDVRGRRSSGRGAVVAQQLSHEQCVATGLFEDRVYRGVVALRVGVAVAPRTREQGADVGRTQPPDLEYLEIGLAFQDGEQFRESRRERHLRRSVGCDDEEAGRGIAREMTE